MSNICYVVSRRGYYLVPKTHVTFLSCPIMIVVVDMAVGCHQDCLEQRLSKRTRGKSCVYGGILLRSPTSVYREINTC